MQTNVKPPSPMLAPEQQPLKPPSPLQPKNTPKTPISHPQRRRRFQLRLSLREQRRWRFHARDFQCPRAMVGPGCGGRGRWRGLAGLRDDAPSHTSATRRRRCGGRRRVRRARAGFEIDHSEPQARVWRSRGRPGPTAPGTPAKPQATSSIANSGCGGRGRWRGLAGLRDDAPSHISVARPHWCGGRRRDRRAWLRRPRAMVGPGRGAGGWRQGQGGPRVRPLRAQLACGDLAGGPPPTGTHSGRALRRPEHPWGREQPGPTSQATRRPEIRRGHKQREYPRQA